MSVVASAATSRAQTPGLDTETENLHDVIKKKGERVSFVQKVLLVVLFHLYVCVYFAYVLAKFD